MLGAAAVDDPRPLERALLLEPRDEAVVAELERVVGGATYKHDGRRGRVAVAAPPEAPAERLTLGRLRSSRLADVADVGLVEAGAAEGAGVVDEGEALGNVAREGRRGAGRWRAGGGEVGVVNAGAVV